jgi:hypothetical protein
MGGGRGCGWHSSKYRHLNVYAMMLAYALLTPTRSRGVLDAYPPDMLYCVMPLAISTFLQDNLEPGTIFSGFLHIDN